MPVKTVSTVLKKVFGTRNERLVKRYLRIVELVSAREEDVSCLSDAELKARTVAFRERIDDQGEKPKDMIPEIFAVAREAMDRAVGIRNIFNPEHGFDPSQLEPREQELYAETMEKIDALGEQEPKGELLGSPGPVPAWQIVDIPLELYAATRRLYPQSKPPFRARPFDVQIIGAVVLHEGRIAEMKTGEGKTIVAPLSTYLAALSGEQVHVVTVNDYLVQRDRDWTFPFFRSLGLTVGAIHPMHMQAPREKYEAYACNVVYGTTAEFGFDYLRDNMKLSPLEQVQRKRDFAIVDEVDSTLIDEARTPLIISGPAHQNTPRYEMAKELALHLVAAQGEWNTADQRVQSCMVEMSGLEGDIRNAREKGNVPAMKEKLDAAREKLPLLEQERERFTQFYEVELDKKKATVTHEGVDEAQRKAGVGSFYQGDNIDLPHLLEQAIRAHTVYQRDRDYVVAADEEGTPGIVIVDQNTGRKMVGRQWSDGLHQAIEAKEAVPIKEETQTMATITIQNFYKLYDRLAGMTGTADTEATEFYEIYSLDVVVIPTNVPVIRGDHNDVVFMSEKDKWEAIVDEIKRFHDAGRPVLVGTTSVEKSDHLSKMLTRKHKVEHEVLNAKQHERESEMIMSAGELGAVMIATNMAGRGTDIRLGRFSREALIEHWQRRGLAPRTVDAAQDDAEIIGAIHRHIAPKELGLSKGDLDAMDDAAVHLALLRHWATEYTYLGEGKIGGMNADALVAALDETGSCLVHGLHMYRDIEDLGGLHVIGTERHESRRIDNQLRGRSGRQGDKGSSRFYLSLEDDLMKMFAGPATLKLLSRLGMKEGDAIEHPMLSKSVSRAQRKVEERNFLVRKNILEYDEVMDHQRHQFYGMRQEVLEGKGVKELIFEHIDEAVNDASSRFLDKSFAANCIAQWVHEHVGAQIDPERIRGKDREDLHRLVRIDGTEEAAGLIDITLGEYLSDETQSEQWDFKSLDSWAKNNFHIDTTPSALRELSDRGRNEVFRFLETGAAEMIEKIDLAPLDPYLVEHYGEKELTKWSHHKFASTFSHEDFVTDDDKHAAAVEKIMAHARDLYARRERTYPVEFAMDMTQAQLQADPRQALEQFCRWARARYELEWSPNALPSSNPQELRRILLEESERWTPEKIRDRAERAVKSGSTPEEIDAWLQRNCAVALAPDEKERAAEAPVDVTEEAMRRMMRAELTQFERWVILQIVDQAWKDHLYAIDQLKESIGLRSFSQRDPRIEFKREGARLFEEMHQSIRDKVTDLIFKAKLTPQVRPAAPRTAPGGAPGQAPAPAARPAAGPVQPAQSATAAAAAAVAGTSAQRRDIEAAERAGQAGAAPAKRRPVRATPTVGRNEPCPCGSGKKFKQCCGKR